MFKSVIAASAALSMSAGAALAGPDVNIEANASYPAGEYSGAATETLGVYGELAGITAGEDGDGDEIIDWAGKVGVKFDF